MAETEVRPAPRHRHEIEPLRWIGAYKLLKGALAIVGGLMVLRLMHRDLPATALKWMAWLHVDPESRFGVMLLHRLLAIRARRLEWVAVALFAYVPLAAAEGVGLILRKFWAEWLTVIATGALVPWEIYEVFRRPRWMRTVVLVLNVAVVIYLIYRIRRDRARPRRGLPVLHEDSPPSPDSQSRR